MNGEKRQDSGNGKQQDTPKSDKIKNMTCFNCHEKGYMARDCPENEEEEEELPMVGMTYNSCCTTGCGKRLHKYCKVCLENGSQVNIVDP